MDLPKALPLAQVTVDIIVPTFGQIVNVKTKLFKCYVFLFEQPNGWLN